MSRRKYTVEKIKEETLDWARVNLGSTFKYRDDQFNAIVSLVDSILNENNKINILSAPTGSGKSIIALASASVLWNLAEKRSYILVSDLYLLNQYKRDIENYHLHNIALLEGQGNYTCNVNKEVNFPNATCRLRNMSYSKLYQGAMPCAEKCTYLRARKKAQASPITIVTYSFYLLQVNYVDRIIEDNPFSKRDAVFCDDAHNLTSIIQSHFSPYISKYNISKTNGILTIAESLRFGAYQDYKDTYGSWETVDSITTMLDDIIHLDPNKEKEKLFEGVTKLNNIYSALNKCIETIRGMVVTEDESNNLNTNKYRIVDVKHVVEMEGRFKYEPVLIYRFLEDDKSLKGILFVAEDITDTAIKLNDYLDLIDDVGIQYLVADTHRTEINYGITLSCIFEDRMCYKYFHARSNNVILMSATIGNFNRYAQNIGVHHIKDVGAMTLELKDKFDYKKSPIFVFRPYRMSWKEKKASAPKVHEIIKNIITHHDNERGIIQTGSYEFSTNLVEYMEDNFPHLHKRLLFYDNAQDKKEVFRDFVKSKNKILVGPTLIEGIDLRDDLCRFIIMMKVPYGNLGNNLIKAQMKYSYDRYLYDTATKVQQGIGRGIRNDKDWCVTYMVDGCFVDFIHNANAFLPSSIKKRVQYVG